MPPPPVKLTLLPVSTAVVAVVGAGSGLPATVMVVADEAPLVMFWLLVSVVVSVWVPPPSTSVVTDQFPELSVVAVPTRVLPS